MSDIEPLPQADAIGTSSEKSAERHAATYVKELSEEAVRYPMLVTLSSLLRILAMVSMLVLVVVAFVMLFVAEGAGQKILYCLILLSLAVFYAVLFFAMSEGIKLAMDVERNTRKSAEKA